MNILLVNIDSNKIPNLALKKIERYYLNQGDAVFWSVNHEVDFQAEYADKIRAVSDLYDIWDGKSKKVILLDNNILAIPDHFKLICNQAIKENILLDFTQGLDHRLLDDEICWYLSKTRHKDYKFAFDDPAYYGSVKRALKLLKKYNLNANTWYVLVGYNTTLQEDFERIVFLKQQKERPYLMRYKREYEYIPMAIWTNRRQLYRKTFKEFLSYPKRIKYKQFYEKNYPFAFNY